MKTIVTITGIRPDFIRMSAIFKLLDEEPSFRHILIHTGQHYDKMLSDVFFQELNIRKPDFTLNTGKESSTHYEQLGYLSVEIFRLFKRENISPDLIIFLGDSNTSCVSLPLKKEGYKIAHIEAGMRSGDKRMLEEINRTVCDHCSDLLFVYHEDYKQHLLRENINAASIHVVGNTIVEVCKPFIPTENEQKRKDMILVDIHRLENFKYVERMRNIIAYVNECAEMYNLDVQMLEFHGTSKCIRENGIELGEHIKMVKLMSFKDYLKTVYHCRFIISDSGTGQEEPALLKTPVIVPRDYTERPQSVEADCSFMLDVNNVGGGGGGGVGEGKNDNWNKSFDWLRNTEHRFSTDWLGDGKTAGKIVDGIKEFL